MQLLMMLRRRGGLCADVKRQANASVHLNVSAKGFETLAHDGRFIDARSLRGFGKPIF
jgi:hypothetical protein